MTRLNKGSATQSIPQWCPPEVRHFSERLRKTHRRNKVTVDLIDRLLFDPRMKTVWDELGKRKRDNYKKTNLPHHKIELTGLDEADALTGLFFQAFAIGRLTLLLPMPGASDPFLEKAALLRADAERIRKSHPKGEAYSRRLARAAEAYEDIQFKIDIHRQAKAVAAALVAFTQTVYGKKMPEIAAIIVSVVTGTKVSGRMVRTWEDNLGK